VGKNVACRGMKRLLSVTLLLATGLIFAGCSDTNDRGVIVNKPYDLFGAAAHAPAPAANPAPASPANNV